MGRKYAKRIDSNQVEIVKQLRSIPGVTVELDHDDILVGYKGRTLWFEIKSPDQLKADGSGIRESAKKDSQKEIERSFTGHYRIVWSIEQILNDLGIGE